MKKVFRISSFIAVFAAISFVLPTVVGAQSVNEARCTVGQKNLESLITKVSDAITVHQQTYDQLLESVATVNDSTTNTEFDGAKLNAAYGSAQTGVQTYTEKATAYNSSLTATKNAACGSEATAYETALTASRTALTELRTAETAVQKTLKEDVVTALTEYSTWLQQNNANTQEEN